MKVINVQDNLLKNWLKFYIWYIFATMESKKTEQAQHSMELITRAQIPPFHLVP